MTYETVFFWIGVISSAFFVLLGMAVFGAFVMNLVWSKFKDGKVLAEVMWAWKERERLHGRPVLDDREG